MISFLETGQCLLSSFLAANLTHQSFFCSSLKLFSKVSGKWKFTVCDTRGKAVRLGCSVVWFLATESLAGSPHIVLKAPASRSLRRALWSPEGTEALSCSAVKLKSEQGVGEQGWCLVFKSQDERQENFWIIKPSLMVVKLALSTFPFFFYAVWKFSERKKEPEDSNQYLMLHYYYYYFEKSMHVWAHSRRWQRTGKPGGLQSMGVTKSRIWLSGWTHTHAHFTSSFIRLYETDIKCLHLWLSFIYWKKKNRLLPVTGTKLGFGETDNERSISGFPGVLRPESEKDGHMIIKQR